MKLLRKIAWATRSIVFGEEGAGLTGYVLILAIIAGGVVVAEGYVPEIQQQYRDIADFVARVFVAVGGPP